MSYRNSAWRKLAWPMFLVWPLVSSCFGSSLFIKNETKKPLVPYPVVTNPPPPHREADPTHPVPVDEVQEIDTEGFNPVYYSGPVDNERPNGLFVGLALYDEDPPLIQYKVFHYVVPPGEEGTDPAKQPILIEDKIQAITDDDYVIRVIQKNVSSIPPQPGQWMVKIEKAP